MSIKKQDPLRVVLLYSTGHLGSSIVFNLLDKMPEIEVVGVMRASAIPFNREGKWLLFRYIKKLGPKFCLCVLWQRIIQIIGYGVSVCMPRSKTRYIRPGWYLARRLGIPTFRCRHINESSAIEFLKEQDPDLIVSAYFNQILGKHVLTIPKKGVLNVHPGWLPNYRGAMSYFWALKNNEQQGGVSLHWMDEGIDTGSLLAQKRLPIKPHMTQQQLLSSAAVAGARMLQSVVRKVQKDEEMTPVSVDESQAAYYPMPTGKDFKEYLSMRRFFRIRDILGTILRIPKKP